MVSGYQIHLHAIQIYQKLLVQVLIEHILLKYLIQRNCPKIDIL